VASRITGRAPAERRGTAGLALGLALSVLAWPPGANADAVSPELSTEAGREPEAPAAAGLEGDAARGAEAYQHCLVCHQPNGSGRPDGTFPRIAGQHRTVIVKQLVDIRERRRDNPVMEPHAQALLDDQEIADVAAHIAALPVPEGHGTGDGQDLERGAALYRRDCASCHGERGEGDAAGFVPALGQQHYAYLLGQVRSIAGGRRGNAHPDMQARVYDYTDDELRAVVDHASRLPGAPRPSSP
jgi:cytochrome c553